MSDLAIDPLVATATAVTMTLVDAANNSWVGAKVIVTFVAAPNTTSPYLWNGATFQMNYYYENIGNTNVFSINLPSNLDISPRGDLSYWRFDVAPNIDDMRSVSFTVQISTAAMDLSAAFKFASQNLVQFPVQSIPVPRATGDSSVAFTPNDGQLYFDITLQKLKVWSGVGNSWLALDTGAASGMVYPPAGLAVSTGTAWGTSLDPNNSYLKLTGGTLTGPLRIGTVDSGNTALGTYAFAQGNQCIASGLYSSAEGMQCQATNMTCHAEGYLSQAVFYYCHAEGYSTISGASGTAQACHAEGYMCQAIGNYSHAEGGSCVASNQNCHAEGNGTTASGNTSHAEGVNTTASGYYTHAQGRSTVAHDFAETAIGFYNTVATGSPSSGLLTNRAFAVGNGTAATSSTCFSIDFSGNVTAAGGATLAGGLTVNSGGASITGDIAMSCSNQMWFGRGSSMMLQMGYISSSIGDAVNVIVAAVSLQLARDPLYPAEAATKRYVDNNFVPITPAGNLTMNYGWNNYNIDGLAPAATAASGGNAPGASYLSLAGPNGQGTTGTTGQLGGNGGPGIINGGSGGAAPAGSTNGNGGPLYLQGGAAGNGAGTAGVTGSVFIQGNAGDTFIGGKLSTNAVHVTFGGGLSAITLSVSGAKTFRIPHPTKPSYELVHACVEGPEAAVYYRGEDITDEFGMCEITLPDYFEALVRPQGRTVQVTPIFEDDDEEFSSMAAGRVLAGRFKVRSTLVDQKFYWEVKAIRADVPELEVEVAKAN